MSLSKPSSSEEKEQAPSSTQARSRASTSRHQGHDAGRLWQGLAFRMPGSEKEEGDEKTGAVRDQLGQGRPLDADVRGRMEHGFGSSLRHVRIHTDAAATSLAGREQSRAVTIGSDIAFGAGEYRPGSLAGDLLLAHELAHTLQQEAGRASLSEGAAEGNADRAALSASVRAHGGGAAPAFGGLLKGGLALRRCPRSRTSLQRALDGEIPWTPALAQQALDQYRGLSETDRQRMFDRYYPSGTFQLLLRALPPGAAEGSYSDMVRDITRRAQLRGVFESARASGLPNQAAMEQTQADLMRTRNLARVQAAQPVAAPPPTEAQVAAQQQAQVDETTIPQSTSTLTPAEVASWTARANAAVTTFVNWASANHPELHISIADFHVDIVAIEERGQGVIAEGMVIAGRTLVVVGRPFVRYVEANPAYALSTVFHELRGHPEYGPYGTPGSEYGLTLYDRAAARMPGYVRPVDNPATQQYPRRRELDAYAYQETEIYSLLREYTYFVPLAPAHTAALQDIYPSTEALIRGHVADVKREWEPRIAKALLRGMYLRYRLDPRITAAALHAFERSVRANYQGAESSIADDILR